MKSVARGMVGYSYHQPQLERYGVGRVAIRRPGARGGRTVSRTREKRRRGHADGYESMERENEIESSMIITVVRVMKEWSSHWREGKQKFRSFGD